MKKHDYSRAFENFQTGTMSDNEIYRVKLTKENFLAINAALRKAKGNPHDKK